MKKVIVIPNSLTEDVCKSASDLANSCQSDFNFYVFPPIDEKENPFKKKILNFKDGLSYLDNKRSKFGYGNEDLILSFYNGFLCAPEHGLGNLFAAGSRYDEQPPCTGIISLNYLNWEVLEEKYNYEVQKHSILHLMICGVIGAYTHLNAHMETHGCLMDFNNNITSFNKKLQKGYYLCEDEEGGCLNKMRDEKYGSSIIRLCSSFKKITESQSYQLTIKEIIMGDKNEFKNSQIGAVGSNAISTNNSFQQMNYNVPENLNFDKLHSQLTQLRENLAAKAKSPEEFKAISEVAEAELASKDKDGNKVVRHLKDAGKWVLDTAKDIGVDVVTELIKKQMEL